MDFTPTKYCNSDGCHTKVQEPAKYCKSCMITLLTKERDELNKEIIDRQDTETAWVSELGKQNEKLLVQLARCAEVANLCLKHIHTDPVDCKVLLEQLIEDA